jgi:hypothetical protein
MRNLERWSVKAFQGAPFFSVFKGCVASAVAAAPIAIANVPTYAADDVSFGVITYVTGPLAQVAGIFDHKKRAVL